LFIVLRWPSVINWSDFSLVVKAIAFESGVFEGSPDRLVFSHGTKLLADGTYFEMGRLLALSLTQGGPGLQCMALPVYQYWTRQPVAVEGLAINLIADYDMQLKVNEVSSSSALDSLIFWTHS
jgi:hypothetical protein